MIVGFTGTQKGMTQRQKDALAQLFRWLPARFLRHGDCTGGDDEAQKLFLEIKVPGHCLIHPCTLSHKRAWNQGSLMHNPLPPLQRNKYIAGRVAGFKTDLLIAAPGQDHEIQRSGTWATVRYARTAGTPVIILLP